jgi:hypothetical protein
LEFVQRQSVKDGYLKAGHEKPFKLARTMKDPVKGAFDHMSDYVEIKKDFRDDDGHVKIAPKNYYTNPNRVGTNGKQIWPTQRFLEFMADDYDNAKKIRAEELRCHTSKC